MSGDFPEKPSCVVLRQCPGPGQCAWNRLMCRPEFQKIRPGTSEYPRGFSPHPSGIEGKAVLHFGKSRPGLDTIPSCISPKAVPDLLNLRPDFPGLRPGSDEITSCLSEKAVLDRVNLRAAFAKSRPAFQRTPSGNEVKVVQMFRAVVQDLLELKNGKARRSARAGVRVGRFGPRPPPEEK